MSKVFVGKGWAGVGGYGEGILLLGCLVNVRAEGGCGCRGEASGL